MKLFDFKIDLSTKKRGPKGEGRATKFKHLLLPESMIEELQIYKNEYSFANSTEKDEFGSPIPAKISYEQMLRHWMDSMRFIDPIIYSRVRHIMQSREKFMNRPESAYDPFTSPLGDFEYFFETDEGEYKAVFRDGTFYCEAPGEEEFDGKSLDEMYCKNCYLITEFGYGFSQEDAHEVCRRLAVVRYDLIKALDLHMFENNLKSLTFEQTIEVLESKGLFKGTQNDMLELILSGALDECAIFNAGVWTIRRSVIDWGFE